MKLLLENDGVLVNEAEIKDLATGNHFKITLTPERTFITVYQHGSSEKPSVPFRILLPGENRLESTGGVRFLIQLPDNLLSQIVPATTPAAHSLRSNVYLGYENLIGDLDEEYAEVRLKRGTIRATMWYWKQILTSIFSFLYKVIRQSLTTW